MAAVAPQSAVRPLTKAPPRCPWWTRSLNLQSQFDECLSGNCRILRRGETLVTSAQGEPEEGASPAGLTFLRKTRASIRSVVRLSTVASECLLTDTTGKNGTPR